MRTPTSEQLTMQWTTVPDGRGGTRLEARWIFVETAVPTTGVATVPAADVAAHAA